MGHEPSLPTTTGAMAARWMAAARRGLPTVNLFRAMLFILVIQWFGHRNRSCHGVNFVNQVSPTLAALLATFVFHP